MDMLNVIRDNFLLDCKSDRLKCTPTYILPGAALSINNFLTS